MQLEDQVRILRQTAAENDVAEFFREATLGLGIAIKDCGGNKGKGGFATHAHAEGQVILQEPPLVAIQQRENKSRALVCANCFRFVGSIEQQLSHATAPITAGRHGDQRAALPLAGNYKLPSIVICRNHCDDVVYCSVECRDAAWNSHHGLLCPAADGSLPPVAAALNSEASSSQRGTEGEKTFPMAPFYEHSNATNDVFQLAAQVVAITLLAAQRRIGLQKPLKLSAQDRWKALRDAWKPFSMGYKTLWWDCVALPESVPLDEEPLFRAGLQELAEDSLSLLVAGLRQRAPELVESFPAVLDLMVWGSIISMFELNNLALVVGNPVVDWAQEVLETDLTLEQRRMLEIHSDLEAVGGLEGILDDEDGWICDGNAFYSIQACLNHSCVPNSHAFKRPEDRDGKAVVLALREIAPGEEITICYVDQEATLEERKIALRDYGFECDCERCVAEALAAELTTSR